MRTKVQKERSIFLGTPQFYGDYDVTHSDDNFYLYPMGNNKLKILNWNYYNSLDKLVEYFIQIYGDDIEYEFDHSKLFSSPVFILKNSALMAVNVLYIKDKIIYLGKITVFEYSQ